MSSLDKPTIVLVPGAWHDSSCWDLVRPELQKLGYASIAPSLVVTGSNPPLNSYEPDVAVVQEELKHLVDRDGKDVILVGHSYGGVIVSSAAQGFEKSLREKDGKPGGVMAVAFISAFLIPKDMNMFAALPAKPEWLKVDPASPEYVTVDNPHEVFHNDVDKSVSEPWIAKLRPLPLAACTVPVKYAAWDNGVPCAYLICDNDAGMLPPWQMNMIQQIEEKAGVKFTVEHVDSSHSVWLSKPAKVAEFLDRIAKI